MTLPAIALHKLACAVPVMCRVVTLPKENSLITLTEPQTNTSNIMYGLIGKIVARKGKREELIEILLGGVTKMPGCLSYVVARDVEDSVSIWITEVWDDQSNHKASLSLPNVQAAITRGKPLIEGFDKQIEIDPVGGHGLRS